jgi:C4-dicarboxylate transporter, DctM subunit
VATTTESAALGVVTWRWLLRLAQQAADLALLQRCFVQTAKTSGMILLIIAAAFVLNLAIS